MKRSKGNKREQQRRRRERSRKLPKPEKQEEKYQLIDGNFTYYPAAYCSNHHAWLSVGLIEIHRCKERECIGYKEGEI